MSARGAEDLQHLAGSTIDQRYRLEKMLGGADGMAVFSACDVDSGNKLTIEVVAPGKSPGQRVVRRRNANLPGELSHPDLLEVMDFGATEAGLRYAVMDRVAGESLSALLARRGRLSAKEAVEVAKAIASVLQAIHAADAVHGNLHPARVYVLERAGRLTAKLSLGLEQPTAVDLETDSTAQLIRSRYDEIAWGDVPRVLMTPPAYSAPEQLLGRAVDVRSDIYSLGAILYEMLRGVPPHAFRTAAVTAAARLALPPQQLPSDIPDGLRREVERSLARTPSARHRSALEFSTALEHAHTAPAVATQSRAIGNGEHRLGDWKVVRQIRTTRGGVHWETSDGFLLVQLPAGFGASPALNAAFIREVEAFIAVSHAGIARVLDSMISAELSYVVLDAPKGITLRELAQKAPPTLAGLTRIALDALDALESAHAAEAVFGDLGLDSMLVTAQGHVVLLPICSRGRPARREDDVLALAKLARVSSPPKDASALAQLLTSRPIAGRDDVMRLARRALEAAKPEPAKPPVTPTQQRRSSSAAPAVRTQRPPPAPVRTQRPPPAPVRTQRPPPAPMRAMHPPPAPVRAMHPPPAPVRAMHPPPAPVRAVHPPPAPMRPTAETTATLSPPLNREHDLTPKVTFKDVVDVSSVRGATTAFPSGLIPIYIEEPPDPSDTERPSVRDLIVAEKLVAERASKRRTAPALLAAILCVAGGVLGYGLYLRFVTHTWTTPDLAPAPAFGLHQPPEQAPPPMAAPVANPTTPTTASEPSAPSAAADAAAPMPVTRPVTAPLPWRARPRVSPPATTPSTEPETTPPPPAAVEPSNSPYGFDPTEP